MFKHVMSVVNAELNDLTTGDDVISIEASDNLLKSTKHESVGFFVKGVLDDITFALLRNRITEFVKYKVEKVLGRKVNGFTLEKYHTFITDDMQHAKIASWEMDLNILSGIEDKIRAGISETLKAPLKLKKIVIGDQLKEVVGFRIVRPSKNDENPFHRDSWMKQWQDSLNVWIPIAGCNKQNSLVVIEKSHVWNESKICRTNNGVVYNNKKFKVCAAISTEYDVNLLVPDPKYGEALVFSPYLIHGNASNNRNDITRVSIELRYARAE